LFIISEVQERRWGIFGYPDFRNSSIRLDDAPPNRCLLTKREHYVALSKA
jgi:hypothetical protein